MAGPWDVVSEEKIGAVSSGGADNPWAVVSQEPLQRNWSDVPGEALRNVGPSAGNFLHALVQPVLHPIDTAQALGNLASGFISKTGRPGDFLRVGDAAPTEEELARRKKEEAGADAVAAFFKDRYGSVEGLKNTLATDPVGAAADAATVLTGGGSMLARAPGVAGTVGQVVTKAGRVVDPVNAAIEGTKLAGKVAGYGTSSLLGRTSGVGGTIVRQAAEEGMKGREASTVFRENMRGADPEAMVSMTDSALGQMKSARGAEYNSGMGSVRTDPAVLDMKPIVEAFADSVSVGTFKGKTVSPSAVKTQNEILDVLTEWRNLDPAEFHTPAGFDALKQRLGDIKDNTPPHTRSRVIANNVYRAVKQEIEKQAPQYGEVMAKYAKDSDQIRQLEKSFARSENAATETAVGRLLSTARNNVTTNYGQRKKLLNELAKYEPALPAAIAGQTLNSFAPRGLTANLFSAAGLAALAHNPALIPLIPAFMPRAVGEAAYYTGRALNPVTKLNQEMLRQGGLLGFQAGRVKNSTGLLGE